MSPEATFTKWWVGNRWNINFWWTIYFSSNIGFVTFKYTKMALRGEPRLFFFKMLLMVTSDICLTFCCLGNNCCHFHMQLRALPPVSHRRLAAKGHFTTDKLPGVTQQSVSQHTAAAGAWYSGTFTTRLTHKTIDSKNNGQITSHYNSVHPNLKYFRSAGSLWASL